MNVIEGMAFDVVTLAVLACVLWTFFPISLFSASLEWFSSFSRSPPVTTHTPVRLLLCRDVYQALAGFSIPNGVAADRDEYWPGDLQLAS